MRVKLSPLIQKKLIGHRSANQIVSLDAQEILQKQGHSASSQIVSLDAQKLNKNNVNANVHLYIVVSGHCLCDFALHAQFMKH